MAALRLWLRHCTAAKAVPALIGVTIVMVNARHGWERDVRWAVDWAGIVTLLGGPAVAGLVAFDRSRRAAPTVVELGKGARRATQGMLALVIASWLWSLVAWVGALVYVGVLTHRSDAVASPDPWSLVLPPVALLAGAALGLAVGTAVPNLAAGPVAAMACFALETSTIAGLFKLPAFLSFDASLGTRIGVERVATSSLLQITMQVVLGLACVFWTARSVALPDRQRLVVGLTTGAVALALLTGTNAVSHRVEVWRTADRGQECLGEGVVVCGPTEADVLLRGAQVSMKAAIERLGGTGLEWQTRYVFTPTPAEVPADSGQLSLQPENMVGDALALEDITYTLMTPRVCQAYFNASPPAALMESQGLVSSWLSTQLAGNGRPRTAGPDVVQAYERLRSCEPARATSRTSASKP